MPAAALPHPVLGERVVRHGFTARPARTVADAARLTCAIQAQDPAASRLGVRSRSATLVADDVRTAIERDRSVVRTWLMRATIHLVATEDVRWLTAAFGAANARKFRKRWLDLGLTDELLARAVAELPDILSVGPLTRTEIVDELEGRGVVIDRTDQAPTHLMLHATTLGLVCRGPDRGRDATFALLDQWVPDAPAGPRGDEALAELARRFFIAYSPATAADFTTWSGLPSSRAIGLIRDELTPVDLDGRTAYRLGSVAPQGGLRLLSGFDNYLVGYRERSLIIDEERRAAVYVGGVIKPTVLLDGRVIGIWRLSRERGAATVEVTAFRSLTRARKRCVEAEVADIGRFVGAPIELAYREV
ncbi:MAG: hypothetical protein QOK11_1515 [Pseudonocardiales bacterium]|nr:hypothetical protein [Pseudonocardiales bacterium]